MRQIPSRHKELLAKQSPLVGLAARKKNQTVWRLYQSAYAEGLDEGWAHGYQAGREAAKSEQKELFQAELLRAKLDSMKELAYGASHEINNPLANIALRAQTMLKREEDADKRKMLEAMHRASMRAHEMISDLMLFARPPAPQKKPISLYSIAEKIVAETQSTATERAIRVTLTDHQSSKCSHTEVWVDPTQIEVALRALVDNSLEAIADGDEIALTLQPTDNGMVGIEVRDNGPGIPDEILPHVFDPFFSGREAGRGLGFGLSKCWRIVTDHGGKIELQSKPAQGVIVRMFLPVFDHKQEPLKEADQSKLLNEPTPNAFAHQLNV